MSSQDCQLISEKKLCRSVGIGKKYSKSHKAWAIAKILILRIKGQIKSFPNKAKTKTFILLVNKNFSIVKSIYGSTHFKLYENEIKTDLLCFICSH